jgi:predicted RNase H-like HicB family nuclease
VTPRPSYNGPMAKRPVRRTRRARQEYSVLVERDADGWYVATVPELRGCHTQARSLDQLMRRVREAIAACRDAVGAPTAEFIGVQRVAV